MEFTKYLIITANSKKPNWGKPNVKLIDKLEGNTIPANSIPLELKIKIPDEAFKKPTFKAVIEVPKDKVSGVVIHSDVATKIENIISEELGFKMQVNVIHET